MRAAPVARGFFVGDYEGLAATGDTAGRLPEGERQAGAFVIL
jgi:hypothetical protein